MPKKKTAAKAPKPHKSFEQNLWDTADKLRGTVESSEYKYDVLNLNFLKFVSDTWENGIGLVEQSHSLSALRDTLLPKLFFGELRAPDAKKPVENAL